MITTVRILRPVRLTHSRTWRDSEELDFDSIGELVCAVNYSHEINPEQTEILISIEANLTGTTTKVRNWRSNKTWGICVEFDLKLQIDCQQGSAKEEEIKEFVKLQGLQMLGPFIELYVLEHLGKQGLPLIKIPFIHRGG